jgi:DNA mismatch endonuclease (patch repair protein)
MTQGNTPRPSSIAARNRMLAARSRNTGVEIQIRKALHASGLRFRIHQRVLPDLRREADIVFRKERVAVFVDGCFWHWCPRHGTLPRANADWWVAKLQANRDRDLDTIRRLRGAGWRAIRVWEHEDPAKAASRIAKHVRARRRQTSR